MEFGLKVASTFSRVLDLDDDCQRLSKIVQDCPRSSISTILFVSDHADRDLTKTSS